MKRTAECLRCGGVAYIRFGRRAGANPPRRYVCRDCGHWWPVNGDDETGAD